MKVLLISCVVVSTLCPLTSLGQTVQAGIFANGTDLVIKARPSAALVANFSGGNLTIKWPTSYGVTLGPITNAVGTWGVDMSGTKSTFSYSVFSTVQVPTIPLNWTGNTEYELFRVHVNQTGVGTGTFSLGENSFAVDWYLEAGADYTNSSTPFYASSVSAVPLPIQLANLSVTRTGPGSICVSWGTMSETNNYGFEIEKATVADGPFTTLPNSLTHGHGSTIDRHDYSFIDEHAGSSETYYRLKQIDLNGEVHYSEAIAPEVILTHFVNPIPTEFALLQNYPNPFNPSTTLTFALPKDEWVKLELYNILGERIRILIDEPRPAGYYSVQLDASGLASSIYLYRITAGEYRAVRKLVVLR